MGCRGITGMTVVVVPVLGGHIDRNGEQTDRSNGNGRYPWIYIFDLFIQKFPDRKHTQADPDGIGIERTCISIVPFPGFHRSLI